MKTVLSLLLGAAVASAAYGASSLDIGISIGAPRPVHVRQAPPPRVIERVSVAPAQGYVWVPGHYRWVDNRWLWMQGAWVVPPQPDAVWIEARFDPASQQWTEGYWAIPQPPPPAPPPPPGPPPTAYVPAPPPPSAVTTFPDEIYIEQPPPPPQREVIMARPSPQHVWVAGYWSVDNRSHRYSWVPGRWERPPPGRHEWDPPRWERRGRGQVFIEGHWR